MYIYVYTYMWYGDRRFAVFTVSPMQMKHKKVRGRDRKERGTKEQESSSIKSLLKVAPQRHFGILWTDTVLYILTIETILGLRWHIEIQLHHLAQRLDAELYFAVSTLPLHGVSVWHCQSNRSRSNRMNRSNKRSEVNITATTFCSCWCGETQEVAGWRQNYGQGCMEGQSPSPNLLQIECHGRTSVVIVLPVRIPLISATAI